MSRKYLLSEIINLNECGIPIKEEPKISHIKILKDEMNLVFYLEGYYQHDYEMVKEQLSYKFPDFNIDVIFNKSENKEINGADLKQTIVNEIIEKIPSTQWWITNKSISIIDDKVMINVEVEGAAHTFYLSNHYQSLVDLLLTKYGLQLIINDLSSLGNDEFVLNKSKEEKSLIKDITKNVKISETNSIVYGKGINGEPMLIVDVLNTESDVIVQGKVFETEIKKAKHTHILKIKITDYTNSIIVLLFADEKQCIKTKERITGHHIKVEGYCRFNKFEKEDTVIANSINIIDIPIRKDTCEQKRVELHAHTKMSALDGLTDVKELIKRAKNWGHKAIAITDHGVVQSFPDAMEIVDNDEDFKVIYGLEAYMIDDARLDVDVYLKNPRPFIVFDIETTGLSAHHDKITEIGAVKIIDGEIVDHFSKFVNPEIPIPYNITKLTSITNEMVANEPTIEEILPEFYEFIEHGILVAHNAPFDSGFIRKAAQDLKMDFNFTVVDTLELARRLFPELKTFRLGFLCKHVGIDLKEAHRAIHDATATGKLFIHMLNKIEDINCCSINEVLTESELLSVKSKPYHVTILVKNLTGLKNLYKLVSISHMDYLYRTPRIPKSLLTEYREGLLIGSACSSGELYQGILRNEDPKKLNDLAKFYDYVEVQPIENSYYLIYEENVKHENDLKEINKRLIELGKDNDKIVVATGDTHYLDKKDLIYRSILKSYRNTINLDEEPDLHFRTTDEMLEAFSYLDEDLAFELVVTNTQLISDQIEKIRPIPKGTYAPSMDGAESDLVEMTYQTAHKIYGDPLPEIVEKRIKKELDSIISNKYAVLYIIAQKLVEKSIKDGYLVGSRGSVGSSVVATFTGITEVNPLPAHYHCSKCYYSEFFEDGEISSGYDLPDKTCPRCGTKLEKDGHNIPFEVFLGFEGDKEPDIDLNFASEYQSKAHQYTEELFGKDYVYRAGTITTVAEKVAMGYVRKYFEKYDKDGTDTEVLRLAKGCDGVKRSTGQHPGGIMVVPKDKEIFDFTPIQYPADDKESGVITTHFAYGAISSTILKLDLLGHDVPTTIKMLEDFTDTDASMIRIDDKDVMALFNTADALNLDSSVFKVNMGTLGIPEFRTDFVRQMLVETQPSKFSDLVKISGLSHGTDVWVDNAQMLINTGKATISDVITTREDIMLKLITAGLEKKDAFQTMEKVRKGRRIPEDIEPKIRKLPIEDWFIDSCNNIKYLFPKAHAVAYVLMSFRIAHYKLYYPLAFYAASFTIKVEEFDGETIISGPLAIKERIKEIKYEAKLHNRGKVKVKEQKEIEIFELALEMYARGFSFKSVDLYQSDADQFLIEDGELRPPLRALNGVAESAAKAIEEERNKLPFNSVEDLVNRCKVTKVVVQALSDHGALKGLSEKDQLSLFDF